MCLGFVLSSVLVGGDTYRSVFGNFRGEMVDALGFFFKEIDFWEGGIDIGKDGKGFVIFLVYEEWFDDSRIWKMMSFYRFFYLLIIRYQSLLKTIFLTMHREIGVNS